MTFYRGAVLLGTLLLTVLLVAANGPNGGSVTPGPATSGAQHVKDDDAGTITNGRELANAFCVKDGGCIDQNTSLMLRGIVDGVTCNIGTILTWSGTEYQCKTIRAGFPTCGPSQVLTDTADGGFICVTIAETDPVFMASPAEGILSSDITRWNNFNSSQWTNGNDGGITYPGPINTKLATVTGVTGTLSIPVWTETSYATSPFWAQSGVTFDGVSHIWEQGCASGGNNLQLHQFDMVGNFIKGCGKNYSCWPNYGRGPLFVNGYVWVTNSNAGTIDKVDPSNCSVVTTIDLGALGMDHPNNMVSDGTYLWVLSSGYGNFLNQIGLINLATNSTSVLGWPAPFCHALMPRSIAFDGTYVWVAGSTDQVCTREFAKFRVSDRSYVATYTYSSTTYNSANTITAAVAPDGNSYEYISMDGTTYGGWAPRIVKFDQNGNQLASRIYQADATVAPGGSVFDGTYLWVAVTTGPYSGVEEVLDTNLNLVATYPASVYNAGGGISYFSNGQIWNSGGGHMDKFVNTPANYQSIDSSGNMQTSQFSLIESLPNFMGGVTMMTLVGTSSGTTLTTKNVPDGGIGLEVQSSNPNAIPLDVNGTAALDKLCFHGTDGGCMTGPASGSGSNVACAPGTIMLDGGGVDWSCSSRHAPQGIEAVWPHDMFDVLVYHLDEDPRKGACDGGPCLCSGGYCQMPIIQNSGVGDPSDAGVTPDSSYAIYYVHGGANGTDSIGIAPGITAPTALRLQAASGGYKSLGTDIGAAGATGITASWWVRNSLGFYVGDNCPPYDPEMIALGPFYIFNDCRTSGQTMFLWNNGVSAQWEYGAIMHLYPYTPTTRWWGGLPQNQWLLMGLVWNPLLSETYWYVGSQATGTVDLVATLSGTPKSPPVNLSGVYIGAAGVAGGTWNGDYQEVRVANTQRSQAWFVSYWKAVMHQGLE